MVKKIPIHPFLFAVFPVVHLYVVNSMDYPLRAAAKPFIVLLAGTALLLLVLCRLTRNSDKAAALLSVFLIWFFSFGPLKELWANTGILIRQRYFLVLYVLAGLVLLYGIARTKTPFLKATKYLNLMGAALVLSALVSSAFFYQKGESPPPKDLKTSVIPAQEGLTPDIYYIILDGHTSEKQMKETLGCDSGEFFGFLKGKGFYVAPDSRSNYSFTRFSLASSLNMEYLPMDTDPAGSNIFILRKGLKLKEMIKKNKVLGFLKSKGYEYVDLSIWNDDYAVADFATGLVRTTILSVPYLDNLLESFFVKDLIAGSLKSFENLCRQGPGKRSPVFVYAHILLPHPPYMFDKEGKNPPFFLKEMEAYCSQAKYVQRKTMAMLENLLSGAGKHSVIILQGDHGADAMTHIPQKDMSLKMDNLSAYYLPGKQGAGLYGSITSVNSFRIVLNAYFNAHYPLLQDRSYYQRSERDKLHLHEPEPAQAGR